MAKHPGFVWYYKNVLKFNWCNLICVFIFYFVYMLFKCYLYFWYNYLFVSHTIRLKREGPFCLLFLFHFRFFPSKNQVCVGLLYYCQHTPKSRLMWRLMSTGAKISSRTKDFCRIKKLIGFWPLMLPAMPILQKFWDFCWNILRILIPTSATGTA